MAAAVCSKYHRIDADPEIFLKWLYNAAKMEIKLHYRKQKRSIKIVENRFDMPDYSMDDIINSIGITSILKLLHASLTPKERELFRLRIIEQKSYAELSAILCKSEGALMTAVSRLLDKVQKIIKYSDGNM